MLLLTLPGAVSRDWHHLSDRRGVEAERIGCTHVLVVKQYKEISTCNESATLLIGVRADDYQEQA